MCEKRCYKCDSSKSINDFHNCKSNIDGKQDMCKKCSYDIYHSTSQKLTNEYICPSCSKITILKPNAYKKAIKCKKSCRKCTINNWQKVKYGEKSLIEFTSNCPKCGSLKKHKQNNISPTQLIYIQAKMNEKLCKSCSNTMFYTLPLIKTNTKPEIKFKEILNELNIKYIQNFKFKYNHYDFYLNELNILVEIDGNYWHGKNLEWGELNKTQQKSRKNDLKKNQTCLDTNQPLIRFWEDEINKENIINKIERCKKNTIY
jgi:G:T-mismatch repair DNA endonuclease (very short patch repair protein)